MRKLLFLFLVVAVSVSAQGTGTTPWKKTFTVNHTCSPADSAALNACINNAVSGEDIVLQDGVTYDGDFDLPSNKPNVRIRCQSGQHCIIQGSQFDLLGTNQWLMGVHVKSTSFNHYSMGGVVANNLFEADLTENRVVGFWVASGTPSPSVFYGNTSIKWEHDLYIQNTAPTVKYVVNNIFEQVLPNGNGRPIHAYTQSAHKMENITFLYNLVRDGEFLVGGGADNTPIINIVIKDNILYNSNMRVDYVNTGQFDIENNRIFRGSDLGTGVIQHQNMWGSGEACFTYPTTPNIVKGNIFQSGGVNYFTARYLSDCSTLELTQSHLRSTDDVDDNTYHNGFFGSVWASGNPNPQGATDLATWHALTSGHGNEYDTNSVVLSTNLTTGSRLYPNDYDANRAHLGVWSFDGYTVTYRTFTRSGGIYTPGGQYGTPVVTFTANVSVAIPITGEYTSYVVKYNP
jgi:hypothetical protein